MHIKDIETRTGLSRANIRYYEQEGLVHPVRARNGYRDYSQEDLDTLLRVRLLRRLDVPIEEIRAMQAGELDLADVLEERIRIAQRREEQARRDQAVCRAMQADRVRYDSLDPEKYWLALHTAAQAAPAAPQADRQEPCPWRRFLARNLDLALCSCAAALAMLAGHISFRQQGFSLLNTIGALLLMLAVEPVLLHLWGTTPGKRLLGLTVEKPDGRRPEWGEAFAYTALALVCGMALLIPVVRLWRLLHPRARDIIALVNESWYQGLTYDAGSTHTAARVSCWGYLREGEDTMLIPVEDSCQFTGEFTIVWK